MFAIAVARPPDTTSGGVVSLEGTNRVRAKYRHSLISAVVKPIGYISICALKISDYTGGFLSLNQCADIALP